MQRADISDVVSLHQTVLGHTLNARIGNWFLGYLYTKTQQSENNGKVFLYKDEDNKMVGFVSVCLDYKKLNKYVTKHLSFSQKVHLTFHLMHHPKQLLELFKKIKFGKYLENLLTHPAAYILTLGLDNQQQGKGVGKQLMQTTEQYFKNNNHSTYFVDTEKTNEKAVGFYKKIGFTVEEIKDGNVVFSKPL